MSKLPFTIAPVLVRRSVSERIAPNGFVVYKKRSRFGLCVALCAAIAFLLPFAAFAADASIYNVFELRAELNGQTYVLDSGLRGDECVLATYQVDSLIDERGVKVAVPHDAPVYCVSM